MNRHSAAGGKPPRVSSPRKTPPSGGAPSSAKKGVPESHKRARILDAAVQIFAEKGFYNAKVSEIAHVAEVADGTIYLYFKSKDDLLISIFEDRMKLVNEQMRAALARGRTPVEKLREVVLTHFAMVEAQPQLAEVLTVELRQSSKFIKEYKHSRFGEFLKLIAAPIVAGQRDGTFRAEVDAPVVARALFGAMDDLALAWILRPRETNARAPAASAKKRQVLALHPARVAAQLADIFIAGLVARPTAALPVPREKRAPSSSRNANRNATTSTTRRAP